MVVPFIRVRTSRDPVDRGDKLQRSREPGFRHELGEDERGITGRRVAVMGGNATCQSVGHRRWSSLSVDLFNVLPTVGKQDYRDET
jgi:hypothetical protein